MTSGTQQRSVGNDDQTAGAVGGKDNNAATTEGLAADVIKIANRFLDEVVGKNVKQGKPSVTGAQADGQIATEVREVLTAKPASTNPSQQRESQQKTASDDSDKENAGLDSNVVKIPNQPVENWGDISSDDETRNAKGSDVSGENSSAKKDDLAIVPVDEKNTKKGDVSGKNPSPKKENLDDMPLLIPVGKKRSKDAKI